MRNGFQKVFCGLTFAYCASMAQSQAAVIVSNLAAVVGGSGSISSSGFYAQEFLTGSSSMLLSDVIVALGGASGSFTASAQLVTDSGGLPSSTVLTSFTVPSIAVGFSNLTFVPAASVTLSANTDYWFILAASGSGSYHWDYTNTTSSSYPTMQ